MPLTDEHECKFELLPAAWVKASNPNHQNEDYWAAPKRSFDGQYAAKLFKQLPLEEWYQSDVYRPKIELFLIDLARWTSEQLMPSWDDKKQRQRQTDLIEWEHALGTMFARVLPFFDLQWVREHFIQPFSQDDEEALCVLAQFANGIVTRHVFDARDIPANVLPTLEDCIQRVIDDNIFNPNVYRAGEVHGFDMPNLIKALLFVNVEGDCPGSARFVNRDWSDIAIIMPLVTKLVTATGWSPFVMENFLTLCEKAGASYPIDAFIEQALPALDSIEHARGSWVGTSLPSRLAGIIQCLAEANYPLEANRARGLLRLIDALIDLGDRRSAALEQDEIFRRVQDLVP